MKVNWIGHIWRRNCLLEHVIVGKVEKRIYVTGRRGRKRKQLLDGISEMTEYCKLKEEALDHNLWRTHCGRGYGPVVRLRIVQKLESNAVQWVPVSLRNISRCIVQSCACCTVPCGSHIRSSATSKSCSYSQFQPNACHTTAHATRAHAITFKATKKLVLGLSRPYPQTKWILSYSTL